jgi:hypothetical protein
MECLPVGMDNQVGTSTCKGSHKFISALLKIDRDQAEDEPTITSRRHIYVPTIMAVKAQKSQTLSYVRDRTISNKHCILVYLHFSSTGTSACLQESTHTWPASHNS